MPIGLASFRSACFVLATAGPLLAQGPVRLRADRVTITPKFAAEGLRNGFEPGAEPPAAMLTTGGGNTLASCLAYSPDGKSLAVGDGPTRPICTFLGQPPVNENGGLIRIIDLKTNQVVKTLSPTKRPGHEYEIVALMYSPDGKRLVAHGKEAWAKEGGGREVGYHVNVWDPATGAVIRRVDSAKLDDWERPTIAPDASSFAAMTHDGLRTWDILTGQERPRPSGAFTELTSLEFSPDGKTLAGGEKTGEVGLWEVASGRRTGRVEPLRRGDRAFEVASLSFAPDGKTLAIGGLFRHEIGQFEVEYFSMIRLLEVATGQVNQTFPKEAMKGFLDAAFSPDGQTLATVGRRGEGADRESTLTLWDVATGRARATVPDHTFSSEIAYSRDGSMIATANWGEVVIRDASDGRLRVTPSQGGAASSQGVALAFSVDGRTLASTNGDFELWDLSKALKPPGIGGHRFMVHGLAYSPDGKRLASASADRTIKIWDVASGRNLITIDGYEGDHRLLAYSPDGQLVASADTNGTARIWDLATGKCQVTLPGRDLHELLGFAPDGRTLGLFGRVANDSMLYCQWDVATGVPIFSGDFGKAGSDVAALSANGGLVAFSDEDRIILRDALRGVSRASFRVLEESAGLCVSNDGHLVIQATRDSSSVIAHRQVEGNWRAETLWKIPEADHPSDSGGAATSMVLTPDARRLAVVLHDSIRVFDLMNHLTVGTIPIGEDGLISMAISPDGKSLAVGQYDGEILIHDLDRMVKP